MRSYQRNNNDLRPVRITRGFTKHAEGSTLVEFGETKVICTATVVSGVPRFLKDSQSGWITAEYGMLPRSTHERIEREAYRGKQGGRTLEIQRLIGRSMRAAIDLKKLTDYTITVDCDVIQADGGTRTAAITGACVAVFDAIQGLMNKKMITKNPILNLVAGVSVGILNNEPILDLDYTEDSTAQTDMNVVMNEAGQFIEIQGTAEKGSFTQEELSAMLKLAEEGIKQLIAIQKEALGI